MNESECVVKGVVDSSNNSTDTGKNAECEATVKGEGASPSESGKVSQCSESSKPAAPVTRIGRPCNNIPKPAVPKQNAAAVGGGRTMTSASSVRSITDELARRRISDGSVLSDSSRKSSSDDLRRKKSSDGSLSVDSYSDQWKLDLEPRRSSDISVVLTQDTDGFIIGDRVWVGGTKAGQIAYIGETQFAPGEWAGVVLDEPIGKNDGSVANIRYFQCEPKKGIFSRLTRLTRHPLLGGALPEQIFSSDHGKSGGDNLVPKVTPKRPSLMQTPLTGSTKSIHSKPSSPDSSIHPNVSVGDRVIVMSSQGSKAGVLRFLGATDFAPGEWCGVELDDPVGKNDGSVAGTRYFECRPKFGLFAPLHKISKSPANRRPSQATCQIHRGGGSAGIRRQGSKESLTSMSSIGSTAASIRSTARKVGVRTPTTPTSTKNALQEMLKEKDNHIELLQKERDLERAEITRAASQADEAEKRLAAVQQEFEQCKEELEARIADLDAMLCLLKAENEEISSQLEEEKKKFEDIQFRFEEVSIEKGDLNATLKALEEKVSVLEKNLADERKRVEVLELDSNKLFEAEEQLVIVRDENESLRDVIAENEKTRKTMEQERVSLEAASTALRAEVESLKSDVREMKSVAAQDESNSKMDLAKAATKLIESEANLSKKLSEVEEMRKELERKEEAIAKMEAGHSAMVIQLKEEHNLRASETSKKLEELETSCSSKMKVAEEKLSEKTRICNDLEMQVQGMALQLSKEKSERLQEEEKLREGERKLQQELSESRELTKKIQADLELEMTKARSQQELIEKLKEEAKIAQERYAADSDLKTKELQGMKELQESVLEQKKKLTAAEERSSNISDECETLKKKFASTVEEHAAEMKKITDALEGKDAHIDGLTSQIETLKKDFANKLNEQEEMSRNKDRHLESVMRESAAVAEQHKNEVETLRKDLEQCRLLLASKEDELQSQSKLSEELVQKLGTAQDCQKLLETEKQNLLLEAGDSQRKLLTVEEKLTLATKQKEKLETDLANFINSKKDTSSQLTDLNDQLRLKEKELDSLREEMSSRTLQFKCAEEKYEKELEFKSNRLQTVEQELKDKENQSRQKIEKLEADLRDAKARTNTLETEWKSKMDTHQRENADEIARYRGEIENQQKVQGEKDKERENFIKTLERTRSELEKRLSASESELVRVKDDLEKSRMNFSAEKDKLNENMEKARAEQLRTIEELTEKAKNEADRYSSENAGIRKTLDETNEKLRSALAKLENVTVDWNKVVEQKEELCKDRAALEERLHNSDATRSHVESRVASAEKENQLLMETINQIREEKWSLDKQLTDNEILIAELRSQLKSGEELKAGLEKINSEKVQMAENLRQQLEASEKIRAKENSEKEALLGSLRSEVDSLKNGLSQVTGSSKAESDVAKATIGELQHSLEATKAETMAKDTEINRLRDEVNQLTESLNRETKTREESLRTISALEKKNLEMKEKGVEQETALIKAREMEGRLEELKKSVGDTEEAKAELSRASKENKNLSESLQESRRLIEAKENLIKTLTEQVGALKEENINLLNNNKITVESLEKERIQLQRKIADMQTENNANTGGAADGTRDQAEEREFTQGQVDFLNSVIVDMQKKNDALKARIEILEMGFSPEDVQDFSFENVKRREVPPRMFCDICEVFDLHETEDCPRQETEVEEAPRKTSKSTAPPVQRPYCEICEVFGHDTADCDDAETF